MRLKVLIVPFFIIITLILAIGYIKPDIDGALAKKDQIRTYEDQAETMRTVVNNVSSLNKSLDTGQEAEQFMYRYLPATLNQEQAIDAFNFLATQSGLSVTDMELTLPPPKLAEEPLITPSSNVFSAGRDTSGNAGAPLPAPPVDVRTFILTGTVVGTYENIKVFFDRLPRIERFQRIHFFSLKTPKKEDASDTAVSDNLVGIFETEYGYLPAESLVSALSMPIFLQPAFDFSRVGRLVDNASSPVPVLEKSETGKPNPFR